MEDMLQMHRSISKFVLWFLPFLLISMVYLQVVRFEFTNWDDESNISKNPFLQKLSFENIRAILSPGDMPGEQLYIPFTYFSYLVESSIFGMKSSVMHFDNLLLHIINSMLVFSLAMIFLRNKLASLLCALLFALHPLQVEAVAWCMGRKDLLMALFSLLFLLKFSDFAATRSKKAYMLSLVFFFIAVFSKPSVFVLPLLLPAFFWYYDRKIEKEDIIRFLPFFVISAIACLINSKLDMNTFGHEMKFVMFRIVFIPVVAEDWLSRILLLQDPIAYYSWYDYYDGTRISICGLLILLSFVTVGVFAYIRRLKIVFIGILLSLVSLLPAAMLVSWSFRDFITADRYGYFPMIGIFLITASALTATPRKHLKLILASALSAFTIFAAWKSYHQVGIWRNSETLWSSVAKARPDSFIAHYNLGNYYFKAKYDLKSAESHYRKANWITPDSDAWFNTGIICELTDRKEESAICYSRAFVLNPGSAYVLKKFALACYARGELEKALRCFLRLTELAPDSPDAYLYCARIFDMKGQKEMAAQAFMCYEKLKKQNK